MPHIQYDRLTFRNGYVYRHCAFPLHNQGLVLVRGLNIDDGGFLACGKTSLWEVFAHVQIGHGGRGSGTEFKKDDVVNNVAGKDFEAVLEYQVDGRPHEIRQYRKHTVHGDAIRVIDLATGRNIIPTSAARAPHKWIREQHLRMDDTSFFNLIYLPQRLNHVLLHGKKADRYKRLTTMFGLDVFDDMYVIWRDHGKKAAASLVDLEALETEKTGIESRLSEMDSLKQMQSKYEKASHRLTKLKSKSSSAMKTARRLRDKLARLDIRRDLIRQIKEIWTEGQLGKVYDRPIEITDDIVEELDAEAEKISERYHAAQQQRDAAQRRDILERHLKRLSGRPLAQISDELAEIKAQLRHLQNTELKQAEQREELAEDLAKLQRPTVDADELQQEVSDHNQEVGALKREIKLAERQLEKSVCPTCHRPLDDTHDPDELREQLKKARKRLRKVTELSFKARTALETADAYRQLSVRLKAIDTTKSPVEVQKAIRKAVKVEKDLVAEQEISQKQHDLATQIKEIDAHGTVSEDKIDKLRTRSATARRRAKATAKIRSRLDQMDDLPTGNRETIAQEMTEADTIVEEAQPQIEKYSRRVTILEERCKEAEGLQERLETVQKGLTKGLTILREKRCLDALKQAFGSKGLKQDRFRAILQDATDTTVPVYSSVLWPRRNIDLELSDNTGALQFQLRRRDGNIVTRSNLLSGGEQHKSGLAMLFGMRDLKESYTESSANILIVDEPFGSLDPQGTAGLLNILRMLKSKFGSVFVVSHRPEVLADPVWDKVWWAIRENNESTLYRDGIPARYEQIAARFDRN